MKRKFVKQNYKKREILIEKDGISIHNREEVQQKKQVEFSVLRLNMQGFLHLCLDPFFKIIFRKQTMYVISIR